MDEKELEGKILEEYRNGNIVVRGLEGLQVMKLDEFIQQPATGILYDLSRLEEEIGPASGDSRWINNYAAAKTIRALRERIEELEATILV